MEASEAENSLAIAMAQEVILPQYTGGESGILPDWWDIYRPSQSMVFLPDSHDEDNVRPTGNAEAVAVGDPQSKPYYPFKRSSLMFPN